MAAAVNALAQLERSEGQIEAAEIHYAETVRLARALGDQDVIAVGLLNLAMVAASRGQHAELRRLLVEVMQIAEHNGSKPTALAALDVCACLAETLHDTSRAARYFGLAEAQNDLFGLQRDPVDSAFLAPMRDAVRLKLGTLAFTRAELEGRALKFDQGWAEAVNWIRVGADRPIPTEISRSKQMDPAA